MIIDKISDIKSEPLFFNLEGFLDKTSLYIKLGGLNIASSIKLWSAKTMVENLEATHCLIPGESTVLCSSSGNLGVAVSIICKEKNYNAICVSDPNISHEASQYIKLYGSELIIVKEQDENGGYLGTRLNLIQSILKESSDVHWLNQYQNQSNMLAHYQITAPEIFQEFNQVDYLFVGAGTTGTLAGCCKFFNKYSPQTKIIAVDVEGSVTFGGAAKKRKIPGLGTSKKPKLAESCNFDSLCVVSEEETVSMCRTVLNESGLFLGGSTGSVLVAVKRFSQFFSKSDTVVAISPDFGGKYINTVYSPEWVNRNFSHCDQGEELVQL